MNGRAAEVERGIDGSTSSASALAAHGVTKRFPGVLANDHIDFQVAEGEVHALLGENGSGKTTLCKLLTGLYQPDAGQVVIGGNPVTLRSPFDAHKHGVFMVHQHFSLVPRLTVAENVMLGWADGQGWRFDRREAERLVGEAAERLSMSVDPRAPIWQLAVGEQQRVEILKALMRGARVLILDEPTAVLTPQEADHLFVSLRQMANDGGSVVFISHKLNEVVAICDRITVLRNGRSVGTVDIVEDEGTRLDTRAIATMMVGRNVQLAKREDRRDRTDQPVRLEIDNVEIHDHAGRPALQRASLQVRAGELVGVAGVAGNGQLLLAEAVAGLRDLAAGSVRVAGVALAGGDPREAIRAGVGYVPEDRMGTGLAPGLRVTENVILKSFHTSALSAGPFIRWRKVTEVTRALLERFGVKGSPDSLVRQLSGGNAQKVLLGREMSGSPQVLVIAAPTRGLDVGATSAIRKLLIEACEAGVAILMISEDLDELLDLADRIAVMCHGRITGVVDARDADVSEIGLLMMGQEAAA